MKPNLIYKTNHGISGKWLLLFGSIFFGSIGQILMKSGINHISQDDINYHLIASALQSPLVLIGVSSYIISSLLWLCVLAKMPLSEAYPFGALTYVLIMIGTIINGEEITLVRLAGVALIILGIIVSSHSRKA